jgi:hypothetical protein
VGESQTLIPLICFILVVINVPFGFIRSRKRRFSRAWGRCIYIPILIGYIFRKSAHLSYAASPYFLIATLTGQIVGSILSSKSLARYERLNPPTEAGIQESE